MSIKDNLCLDKKISDEKIINYLKELDQIGVDAIIISDPAIISLAKENTNLDFR